MLFHRKCFCLAIIASAVQVAYASESPSESDFGIKFSGFGTVGAVKTDTDLAEFTNFAQVNGASKKINFAPDSKLGIQLDANFNNIFSGTIQTQSEFNSSGNWDPSLVLGFGKAKLGGMATARVGRLGIPFFLVSDFRNVGYANVWLRPPLAVYGQVPIKSFDGADLQFQGSAENVILGAQIYVGSGKVDSKKNASVTFKNLVGVNLSAQIDLLAVRIGYAKSRASIQPEALAPLISGLKNIGAIPLPQFSGLSALADELDIVDNPASFSSIGASYEGNNLIINAEYTQRKIKGAIPSTTGWYTTVGYRFGNWTPYVTGSRLKQTSPTSTSAIPTVASLGPAASTLPPEVLGALPSLEAGVNSLLASIGQKSGSIGVRWDAMKNIAVKVQYERIRVDSGLSEGGGFVAVKPGFGEKPVNVYSAAVDFVF